MRSPECSRNVVGACSPIRHPDGTAHRSVTGSGQPRSHLYGGRGDQLAITRFGGLEVGHAAVQQSGVQTTGHHVGIGQQEAKELDVGGHPEDSGARQRRVERAEGAATVLGIRDDLRQHRVVVAADHGAAGESGVDANPWPTRLGKVEHGPAGRQEAATGISA